MLIRWFDCRFLRGWWFEEPASELLVVETDGLRGFWFYGKDAWLSMPRASFDVRVEVERRMRLVLRSETLIRDLHLDATRISMGARAESNLFTMLPGEERAIV